MLYDINRCSLVGDLWLISTAAYIKFMKMIKYLTFILRQESN